jgi:TIGR03009 family protein
MLRLASFATVLIAAVQVVAQAPTPPNLNPAGQRPPAAAVPNAAPLNPANNRLDQILLQWEQKMQGVQSLVARIKKTETDGLAKTSVEGVGYLKYTKPNRADLYIQRSNNQQIYERFLSTGNNLFVFLPKQNLIRVYSMPQRAPGQPVIDNSFVGFLAGMSAVEARRRFDMTLVKEDQHYAYIIVKPLRAEDKAEFSEARIALLKTTMMPREMQFVPPDGNPIKWDIQNVEVNAQIPATDFATPQMKQYPGWQMQQMPAAGPPAAIQPPPSKVRPNGK